MIFTCSSNDNFKFENLRILTFQSQCGRYFLKFGALQMYASIVNLEKVLKCETWELFDEKYV